MAKIEIPEDTGTKIIKKDSSSLKDEIRICVVVTGKDEKEFMRNLEKAQEKTSIVELRVDYMADVTDSFLEKIRKSIKGQAIFTCRKASEGGKFKGSETARIRVIQKALDLQFDYLDIELSTVRTSVFNIRNTKIIVSFHDFEATPNDAELKRIVKSMRNIGADIIKIATKVRSEVDNRKLIRILANKDLHEEMIIIGMGEKGRKTRIIAPLIGAFLTFASIGGKTTASGQIDIEELKEIYNYF
ncbi:MAG TPA: type I 3-dehydroquinate dehydratase [Candidatus Dojkabacteria bacterium]|jgi:3-dehydroquinate dehydratase-1